MEGHCACRVGKTDGADGGETLGPLPSAPDTFILVAAKKLRMQDKVATTNKPGKQINHYKHRIPHVVRSNSLGSYGENWGGARGGGFISLGS